MAPILLVEAMPAGFPSDLLWLRGGLPPALLAESDSSSQRWRTDYLRDVVERDLQLLGLDIQPQRMWRFMQMLAHVHGQLWNGANLALSLGLSASTVGRYLDALEHLFFVRRLNPFFRNLGKRLRKSPKIYLRDTGLLHTLLALTLRDDLERHPVYGFSWEGFVIEQLIGVLPQGWDTAFWRTSAGAEIDLLLLRAGVPEIAIEIKRGPAQPSRGFYTGSEDLHITQKWLITAEPKSWPLPHNIEALPLLDAIQRLQNESMIPHNEP